MEEPEERDLSPITILLVGSLVLALVVKALERVYRSVQAQQARVKFRRRTREEEEEEIVRLARARAQQQQAVEEEEEEEEEEALLFEHEADYDYAGRDAGGRLSRRDLAKIEKKRRKEEQREAVQARLQHERDLRELRAKEDEEEQEFERRQRAERARLAVNTAVASPVTAAPPPPPPPSEDEVQRFFALAKETPLRAFRKRFPQLVRKQRTEAIDRLLARGGFVRLPLAGGEDKDDEDNVVVYRVDEEDVERLRAVVRERGSVPHAELVALLVSAV